MKKRLFSALLAALLLVGTVCLPTAAADEIIGEAKYTGIVAYIDGYPISSYNVNNNTYIMAEELPQYGFLVTWDGVNSILKIHLERTAPPEQYTTTYVAEEVPMEIRDTHRADIYATKVRTFIGDTEVQASNIGGYTLIWFDDLANYTGSTPVWDGVEGALRMTSAPFSTPEKTVKDTIANEIATVQNRSFTGADAILMNEIQAFYGADRYAHYMSVLNQYASSITYTVTGTTITDNTAVVKLDLTTRDNQQAMEEYLLDYRSIWYDMEYNNITMSDDEFFLRLIDVMLGHFANPALPTVTKPVEVYLNCVNGIWEIDVEKSEAFFDALGGGLYDNMIPPKDSAAA